MPTIHPRCKADRKEVYIDSSGFIFPCCWLGNEPDRADYFAFHGVELENLNLNNDLLSKILVSDAFLKIERSWTSVNPFSGCLNFCSKPIHPLAQEGQKEKQGTNDMFVNRFNKNVAKETL